MAPSSSLPRAVAQVIVLVIDHDVEARATRAYALSAFGFDVMTAADATEAHARAGTRRPDIILANIALNGGHDWTLLSRLGALETDNIPVVVVTADAASAVCARAEREGCAALCVKSCPPGELARGLRSVLAAGATQRRS